MIRKYTITPDYNGLSISKFLDLFKVGKEKRKNLIIKLNEIDAYNNSLIYENDILSIEDPNDHPQFEPWDKKLDILFENEYVLVVNKKPGMIVHPDGVNNNHTLANMVSFYYQNTNQDISVKVIHRIDTDTSGIVIFPKDILTQCYLAKEIEENRLHRTYMLICSGKLPADYGTLDFPIAEDRHIANKKRISETGKEAITDYKLIEKLKNNLNVCEATLRTGRTHQIRLHFSHIGCPLVGDKLYNGNTNLLKRQALHSYKVEFVIPFNDEEVSVISPIPLDMENLINSNKK